MPIPSATLEYESTFQQLRYRTPSDTQQQNDLSYNADNFNSRAFKYYIHSYNYVPEFSFNKIANEEELYLGCEIEIDKGGKSEEKAKFALDIINEKSEIAYCKYDGSLEDGFEIVTHPCTYEYHKSLNYMKLFDMLISKGYRAHDTTTCGLHIHINRNYFGEYKLDQDLCISKMLYLFEKFWDKITLIARRNNNKYAQRFRLYDDETPLDIYAKSKNANKYGAINLSHKNSIEIRIFKGTLNKDTYFSTLEFVKVMANLAKETDIYYIQRVVWEDISQKFSDELNKYIEDRIEKDITKMESKFNNIDSSITIRNIIENNPVSSVDEFTSSFDRCVQVQVYP